MKVIIAGSRKETDAAFVEAGIAAGLTALQLDGQALEIVTGGARGVDTLAHAWAERAGHETHVFSAAWSVFGRAAGVVRNNDMATYVAPDGALIAIARDLNESKGTRSMVTIARHKGLRVYVHEGSAGETQ